MICPKFKSLLMSRHSLETTLFDDMTFPFSFFSRLGPLIFGIPGGANGKKGGIRWLDENG